MKLCSEIWDILKKQKLLLLTNLFFLSVLAFSGSFSLYAQAYFIDTVESVIRLEQQALLFVCPAILLFISLMLPTLSIITDYTSLKIAHLADISWNKKINELVKRIPYARYESEEAYNLLKQIGDNNLYNRAINCGFSIISAVVCFACYAYVLLLVSVWLAVSVLILAPAIGYISSSIADKQYRKSTGLNSIRRRGIYKSSILRSRKYAKDIRVNGCSAYMIKDWFDTQQDIDSKILQIKFKYGFLSALAVKSEYVIIFINLVIILFTYLNDNISLGVFISISNQIFSMRLLSKVQSISSQLALTKAVYRSYMEASALAAGGGEKKINGKPILIEFEHVSFRYPGDPSYVLQDVTFRIHSGESVAIVGENGVGKSTLIKLMLGLYTPNEGRVLLNGVDVTALELSERANIFGVAFQDFSRFCLTLEENLTLSEKKADAAYIAEKFHIDKLAHSMKDGYAALLGKDFGRAIDVSGGQWQSIALARSVIGDKRVLIFDEPTASLDPIREVETFDTISSLTKGCISIFITHRLGFTTKVGRVILLKEKRIWEDGSFHALMDANGEFKRMFDMQRSLYTREAEA